MEHLSVPLFIQDLALQQREMDLRDPVIKNFSVFAVRNSDFQMMHVDNVMDLRNRTLFILRDKRFQYIHIYIPTDYWHKKCIPNHQKPLFQNNVPVLIALQNNNLFVGVLNEEDSWSMFCRCSHTLRWLWKEIYYSNRFVFLQTLCTWTSKIKFTNSNKKYNFRLPP